MSADLRLWLAFTLFAVGLAWVVGVGVIRGRSRSHSAITFWLHLTAPLVCIILELIALALILTR
jgi:hypothetical protein